MIIDRGEAHLSPATVGARPISKNIAQEHGEVTRQHRERLLGQNAATIWLTGLSGAGKSTLAYALEQELTALGNVAYVIDGDNVRHGLNRDLGFAPADRTENIRRVAEVAVLMQDVGVIVICAFISPYADDRTGARRIIGDSFLEVFVDASLEVCEQRDRKGLYTKARAGEIADFTGVSAPYEAPTSPDIHISSESKTVDENVQIIIDDLRQRGVMR
jgi:adenylyl-sulfate kinase